MIVTEPPYDLVFLFADLDAEKLFQALLERGQVRQCLREFRWRGIRDARRDTISVDPTRILAPFLKEPNCKFLVSWDYHGSGRDETFDEATGRVNALFDGVGVTPEKVCLTVFEPEIEVCFEPVWERVKKIMATKRSVEAPSDEIVFEKAKRQYEDLRKNEAKTFSEALITHPKEIFDSLIMVLNLRHSSQLYADLGITVSLPKLKTCKSLSVVDEFLRRHFPVGGNPGT